MADMTPERLAEIKARADAATPGPWGHGEGCCGPYLDYQAHQDERGCGTAESATSDYDGRQPLWLGGTVLPTDRLFIAHTRQDIPALIAALESAWAEVERLKDRVKEFEESVSTCENCKKPLDYISVCIKCGCCPKCCDEINCDGG